MATAFYWFPINWKDVLTSRELGGLSLTERGAWLTLACKSMAFPQPGIFADESGSWSPERVRACAGIRMATWDSLVKSGSISVILASNSCETIVIEYIRSVAQLRQTQSERQRKHREKREDVTPMSRECHAPVTRMSRGELELESKSESQSDIPPLPPAGEGPAVEAKKPSSKSGLATWEQAWSAFCDGAALDARGAADYEYPAREWFEHKKSKGPLSERGWRALGRQVKTWGADRLRQAVDYSSSNGYQGLFEAKTNGKPVYQSEAPRLPHISEVD